MPKVDNELNNIISCGIITYKADSNKGKEDIVTKKTTIVFMASFTCGLTALDRDQLRKSMVVLIMWGIPFHSLTLPAFCITNDIEATFSDGRTS